jgi:hypothetical protein
MWRLQPEADTKVITSIAKDLAYTLKGRRGPLSQYLGDKPTIQTS